MEEKFYKLEAGYILFIYFKINIIHEVQKLHFLEYQKEFPLQNLESRYGPFSTCIVSELICVCSVETVSTANYWGYGSYSVYKMKRQCYCGRYP